jgi:hypothetical protein
LGTILKLFLPSIIKGLSLGLDEILKNQEFNTYWNNIRSKLFEGYKVPAQMTKDFQDGKEF